MNPEIGQDVHFVLSDSSIRPFKVVKAFGGDKNLVNGLLFLDGNNDSQVAGTRGECVAWKVSVYYDKLKRPNTWHFTGD